MARCTARYPTTRYPMARCPTARRASPRYHRGEIAQVECTAGATQRNSTRALSSCGALQSDVTPDAKKTAPVFTLMTTHRRFAQSCHVDADTLKNSQRPRPSTGVNQDPQGGHRLKCGTVSDRVAQNNARRRRQQVPAASPPVATLPPLWTPKRGAARAWRSA